MSHVLFAEVGGACAIHERSRDNSCALVISIPRACLVREFLKALVVLAPQFEVALCMIADWAVCGCFAAFVDITTVSAFPFGKAILLEDLPLLYVLNQFPVASFMIVFDLRRWTFDL